MLEQTAFVFLMNETGLVFIPTLRELVEEASRHHERVGNTKQLKKMAKAVYRCQL